MRKALYEKQLRGGQFAMNLPGHFKLIKCGHFTLKLPG
jgi:hypothetical protein